MGNAACLGDKAGLESLCAGRGFPEFAAPNTEFVKYSFGYLKDEHFKFLNGEPGAVTAHGFRLDPTDTERRTPRWFTVKEYVSRPTHLRLIVSGRVYLHCPDTTLPEQSVAGCAFKICTRGHPVFESLRTKTFTHTAQVVTSGVFFSLVLTCSPQGLFLAPRLALVLESGDEVELVDDKLGPLQPQSFYTDFAILDDGGRNMQIDLIFRGGQSEAANPQESTTMRTLRTCLQDYTAFNNYLKPASVTLGSSQLASILPLSSVHLQNLVISEDHFEDSPPEPEPYNAFGSRGQNEQEEIPKVLFKGEDAQIATEVGSHSAAAAADQALAAGCRTPPVPKHPQLASFGEANGGNGKQTWSFWHHIKYDDERDAVRSPNPTAGEITARLKGEFWLSKQAIDKKHTYFQCSSTLAQAMTMCIAFRFSCPQDYLQLIEQAAGEPSNEKHEAIVVLREWHIPANCVVMGIENDPRHKRLLRMFIENRNEIKDDMVVCEYRAADANTSVVHQEVYDGGSMIAYRLTILHADGARQSAVLQWVTDELEDANVDASRSGSQYRLVEEPSPRFPISPCSVKQMNLSPMSRIFVFSASAFDPKTTSSTEADGADAAESPLASAMMSPSGDRGVDCGNMSEGTAEDWQSINDGQSEGHVEVATAAADPARSKSAHSVGDENIEWRRPVVESAVVLSGMADAPFKCFPNSLS